VYVLRRKESPNKTEIGSVKSHGRKLKVRVIKDEYLPVQKLNKYKYEVISPNSDYFQCVDDCFSDKDVVLKAGHRYSVSFMRNSPYPKISKIIEEIKKDLQQPNKE